ncbi:hypothetical protein Tco_0525480 [Tanacetum coccineum]
MPGLHMQNGVAERKNRTLLKLLELSKIDWQVMKRIIVGNTLLDSTGLESITGHKKAYGRPRNVLLQKVQLSSEDKLYMMSLKFLNAIKNLLPKLHNDDQRILLKKKEKEENIYCKGKEHVDRTFTLSTATTPLQSTLWNTLQIQI